MTSLTYLPFALMPLISYMVIIYIYPILSFHISQYSNSLRNNQTMNKFFHIKLFVNLDDVDEEKAKPIQAKITKKSKRYNLISLFLTSLIMTMILVMLHITSAAEFIDYGNDVLLDEGFPLTNDHYLPYIHAVISYTIIIIMLLTAIIFSICKWNLNSLLSTSISVNVIYTMCYFFPTILLAFIHDPLQITYTCFMVIFFIVPFIYAFIWCIGLALLSRVLLKHDHFTLFSLKTLIYFVLLLTAVLAIYHFFNMIVNIVALGSFSDFQDFQSIIFFLLFGLLSFSILKPARNYVYKYVTAKTESVVHNEVNMDVEIDDEKNNISTISNNCADQTEAKENDGQLHNDEDTIV